MRVLPIAASLLAAASLSGCAEAEGEEGPDIDVEAMNRAALGPPQEITPEPIDITKVEEQELFGMGCNFLEGGVVLFIGQADDGAFFIDGKRMRVSADTGSKELPYGARMKYDGLRYSVMLNPNLEAGAASGEEVTDYPGRLTIRDEMERTVYNALGTVQCGA